MSLVVSWIGIDTHGPTSTYIVSDSRISWQDKTYYDFGRKVFASKTYPDIFGYAGDVLFPTIILEQLLTMIDSGLFFSDSLTCAQKNKKVFDHILNYVHKYPDKLEGNSFQIIHISRETIVKGYPQFNQYLLEYKSEQDPIITSQDLPAHSDILAVLGSGKSAFIHNYENKYQKGDISNTSRNVFHCFIDTLKSAGDKTYGGPPQLVGIYRKPYTPARDYGIIIDGNRYCLGINIPDGSNFESIEWRNDLFELCSGETKEILTGAMRQPNRFLHL